MNNIPPVSRALPSCLHGREAHAAVSGCAKGRRKKDGSYIQDSEYIRNGTCSIFLFTEPLAGFRYVTALEHSTKVNWARQMKHIADNVYPQAEKIIMVCDNLNTHDKSSFYEAFPPAEALRLAKRFEFHHTPKHGSRLDIAEIELAALTKQCLGKNGLISWRISMSNSRTGNRTETKVRKEWTGNSLPRTQEASKNTCIQFLAFRLYKLLGNFQSSSCSYYSLKDIPPYAST